MRRWILLAALALVALAAFAPHTLWAEGAGVRGTVPDPPEGPIFPQPESVTVIEPDGQATFRVVLSRKPYTGTVVTVPLALDSDECTLSTDQVELDETNWDTGAVVTVTASADDTLDGIQIAYIDIYTATSLDTHFDGVDSPVDVRVSVIDPRIVQPFIARSWDNTYWETEPNEEMEQADGPIPHGTYIRGRVSSENDDDYYWFEMTGERDVTVILDQIPSGQNYNLLLYDEYGAQKGYSAYWGNTPEEIVVTLQAGIYHIRAYPYGSGGSSTPYRLRVWYK